jgi:predicted ABC-type sugar transport system permease subunit
MNFTTMLENGRLLVFITAVIVILYALIARYRFNNFYYSVMSNLSASKRSVDKAQNEYDYQVQVALSKRLDEIEKGIQ